MKNVTHFQRGAPMNTSTTTWWLTWLADQQENEHGPSPFPTLSAIVRPVPVGWRLPVHLTSRAASAKDNRMVGHEP